MAQGDRSIRLVLIASRDSAVERFYVCEPDADRITVLNQQGTPLFSFGNHGSSLGQFDRPTDIALVSIGPTDPSAPDDDAAVLAVADCGNHRVQFFELDGLALWAIGGGTSGLPIAFPTRLAWRAPYLDVECGGTGMLRVDLTAALSSTYVRVRSASVAATPRGFA